jgi:hypothetical protein
MFRGCLFCYGKTPQELELEIIEEVLTEGEPQMTNEFKIQNAECKMNSTETREEMVTTG